MKRITAFLLVLCMVFSLLPVMAFATDGTEDDVPAPSTEQSDSEQTPAGDPTPPVQTPPEQPQEPPQASPEAPPLETGEPKPSEEAQTAETVNVTFVVDDVPYAAVEVTKGTALGEKMPAAPTKDGCTFTGWIANGAPFTRDTPVETATQVTAGWTENTAPANDNPPPENEGAAASDEIQASPAGIAAEVGDLTSGGISTYELTADHGKTITFHDSRHTPTQFQETTDLNDVTTVNIPLIGPITTINSQKFSDDKLPNHTATGYQFMGWFNSSSNRSHEVEAGTDVKNNLFGPDYSNLYAHWNKVYTLTFNPNGGTGGPAALENKEISEDKVDPIHFNLTGNETAPTYPGREFLGWSSDSSATTPQITANSQWDVSFTGTQEPTTFTLYAVWSAPEEHTVTFMNGDNQYGEVQAVTYGEKATNPTPSPTEANKRFVGWFAESAETAWDFDTSITEDVTLYAHWVDTVDITYTIVNGTWENKTGSEATTFTKTVDKDSTLTPPTPVPNTGYEAGSWNETPNSAETATFTYTCKQSDYTITYNANGGTEDNVTSPVLHYGDSATISDKPDSFTAPANTAFGGWNTAADGTGTHYDANATITITGNLTLYAEWKQLGRIQLVIYKNGNTTQAIVNTAIATPVQGTEFDLSQIDINNYYSSDYGFEFEGFYNDGGWNQYKNGNRNNKLPEKITVNGWTNVICMVTDYEKVVVYGTIGDDKNTQWEIYNGTALHGTNVVEFLEQNVPIPGKDHYTSDKWYKYDSPQFKFTTESFNGWTNVMVKYNPVSYPVSVNVYRNGDTSNPAVSLSLGDYPYGTSYQSILEEKGYLTSLDGLYSKAPGASGFEWDQKWYHEASNIGKWEIGDGTINGYTNLCAMVWDIYPAYAYVYCDGNTTDPVATQPLGNFKYGTSYKEALGEYLNSLDGLYSGDCTWDQKWYHEASNIGKWEIGDGAINGYTNLCTMVYSKVTLTYDANGGTGKMSSKTVDKNETVDVASNKFTAPTGKKFDKWTTNPDGTGESYAPGDTITIDNNMTLFAQWKAETFTVIWDSNKGKLENNAELLLIKDVEYGTKLQDITPNDPKRAGYRFIGWKKVAYSDSDIVAKLSSLFTTTTEKEVTSNLRFQAQWQKIHHGKPDLTNPRTSDDSHIHMWVGILGTAAVGLIAAAAYALRTKKRR